MLPVLLCPSGAEGRAKTRVVQELPLLCCPALLLLLETPGGKVNAVTRAGAWPHSSSGTDNAASSAAALVIGEGGRHTDRPAQLHWTALAAGCNKRLLKVERLLQGAPAGAPCCFGMKVGIYAHCDPRLAVEAKPCLPKPTWQQHAGSVPCGWWLAVRRGCGRPPQREVR